MSALSGLGELFFFFCLETKETKIQGYNFLCYKLEVAAKSFEPAFRRQARFRSNSK